MNKVIITGRLTKDPELNQTQSGTTVMRFSVAVDRYMGQGKEKQTDFIGCVAFNKTAEFISKYFSKGNPITVEGSIKTGSYNDKRYSEVKHYTQDVWVEKAEFVIQNAQNGAQSGGDSYTGSFTNRAANTSQTGAQTAYSASSVDLGDFEEINVEDLPF